MLFLIGDSNRCVGIAESMCQVVRLDKAYTALKLEGAHSSSTYGVHLIILLVPILVFYIRF